VTYQHGSIELIGAFVVVFALEIEKSLSELAS
jgi:hypothetical protein